MSGSAFYECHFYIIAQPGTKRKYYTGDISHKCQAVGLLVLARKGPRKLLVTSEDGVVVRAVVIIKGHMWLFVSFFSSKA